MTFCPRRAGDPLMHISVRMPGASGRAETLLARGANAQNSGREQESLIGSESSLITDLNSLQGRKKFPVRDA
jgi:hypothetical protein